MKNSAAVHGLAIRILRVDPHLLEVMGVLLMSAGVNWGTNLTDFETALSLQGIRAVALIFAGTLLYLVSKVSAEIRAEANLDLLEKQSGTFAVSLYRVALDIHKSDQTAAVFWRTVLALTMVGVAVVCSVW
jgi:hypothetical protein